MAACSVLVRLPVRWFTHGLLANSRCTAATSVTTMHWLLHCCRNGNLWTDRNCTRLSGAPGPKAWWPTGTLVECTPMLLLTQLLHAPTCSRVLPADGCMPAQNI